MNNRDKSHSGPEDLNEKILNKAAKPCLESSDLESSSSSSSSCEIGHHKERDGGGCRLDCSCVCLMLPELEKSHKFLHIRTKSGDEISGFIKCFDKCTGCLILIQPEVKSPCLPEVVVIISCLDIESISFEVHKHKAHF